MLPKTPTDRDVEFAKRVQSLTTLFAETYKANRHILGVPEIVTDAEIHQTLRYCMDSAIMVASAERRYAEEREQDGADALLSRLHSTPRPS